MTNTRKNRERLQILAKNKSQLKELLARMTPEEQHKFGDKGAGEEVFHSSDLYANALSLEGRRVLRENQQIPLILHNVWMKPYSQSAEIHLIPENLLANLLKNREVLGEDWKIQLWTNVGLPEEQLELLKDNGVIVLNISKLLQEQYTGFASFNRISLDVFKKICEASIKLSDLQCLGATIDITKLLALSLDGGVVSDLNVVIERDFSDICQRSSAFIKDGIRTPLENGFYGAKKNSRVLWEIAALIYDNISEINFDNFAGLRESMFKHSVVGRSLYMNFVEHGLGIPVDGHIIDMVANLTSTDPMRQISRNQDLARELVVLPEVNASYAPLYVELLGKRLGRKLVSAEFLSIASKDPSLGARSWRVNTDEEMQVTREESIRDLMLRGNADSRMILASISQNRIAPEEGVLRGFEEKWHSLADRLLESEKETSSSEQRVDSSSAAASSSVAEQEKPTRRVKRASASRDPLASAMAGFDFSKV